MAAKPKIFVWVTTRWADSGDVVCTAITQDGTALACHLSSNERWALHDMGVTSDRKSEGYQRYYPDGYEVVFVEKPETDPEFGAAYKNHCEKYPDPALANPAKQTALGEKEGG